MTLAMMLLSPEGGSGQCCPPLTHSSCCSAPGIYRLERKERYESCGSSGIRGAATAPHPYLQQSLQG